MKILITGAGGFLGKSLNELLSQNKNYIIDAPTRGILDLTNLNKIERYLGNWKPNFIVNCAIAGEGRLLKEDTHENFYQNCQIIENLLYLQNKYSFKLIQFTSGAQWNRNQDIINVKEGEYLPPPD